MHDETGIRAEHVNGQSLISWWLSLWMSLVVVVPILQRLVDEPALLFLKN